VESGRFTLAGGPRAITKPLDAWAFPREHPGHVTHRAKSVFKGHWISNPSIFLHQAIPDSSFSLEVARAGRIRLEFLPEVGNVNAQIIGMVEGIWPPNFPEYVLMREHP